MHLLQKHKKLKDNEDFAATPVMKQIQEWKKGVMFLENTLIKFRAN
jgi:hypothetical protein